MGRPAWRCLSVGLVAAVLGSAGAAVAQPQDATARLQRLFERDPAAGFEEAARLFRAPQAEGDLAGMMAILRVVGPWADWARSPSPYDRLAVPAAQLAEKTGKWKELAEIHGQRGLLLLLLKAWWMGPHDYRHRALFFFDQALKCYEKAGTRPLDVTAWVRRHPYSVVIPKDKAQPSYDLRALAEMVRGDRTSDLYDEYVGDLPAGLKSAFGAAAEAHRTGGDEQALTLVCQALDVAGQGVGTPGKGWAFIGLAPLVSYLPGGEAVLPRIDVIAQKRIRGGDSMGCWDDYQWCLTPAWSGQRDVFYQALMQYVTALWQDGAGKPHGGNLYTVWPLITKLAKFGHTSEASWTVGGCFEWSQFQSQSDRDNWEASAAFSVTPTLPQEQRETLLTLSMRWAASGQNPSQTIRATRWAVESWQGRPSWSWLLVRMGNWLLEGAYRFGKPEDRATLAEEAALAFEAAQRADLAQAARRFVATLAEGKPDVILRCALGAARGAAAGAHWDQVEATLEAPLSAAGLPPSPVLLEALALQAEAKRGLGKAAEASTHLRQATDLLGRLTLPPVRRVGYLMALASATPEAAQKARLLDQARQAAGEAGLEGMQESVAEELAQVALDRGDLPAAHRALGELVTRQEAKRERLAFDPLLREQWFADSLGPYRRLLRVAVLQRDTRLALECAEKMRSRALLDQLAWRKVDMALALPAALQRRLDDLREARKQAYGLLQQAAGSAGGEGGERGTYLPIRGAYIPVRGPLDSDQPAGAPGTAQLKGALESLAREETALESAIRAAVPAYQRASQTALPTPEALQRFVAADPGLAVLEYTLTDSGIAVIGLRGGKTPDVWLVKEPGESVRAHVGKLRGLIWERREEAAAESRWLYDTLVSPMERLLVGAKRLWVVSDGALQLVPFAALQDVTGQWLVQRMAVAYTPSLSVALATRNAPAGKAALPALVVAAPDTGAAALPEDQRGAYVPIRGAYMPVRGGYMPIRGEDGVSTALTSMATMPLPGALAEGQVVAGGFPGSRLLQGAEATKARLLDAGRQCEVLHLATHGYADPEVPEFSGLLLARTAENPYEVLTAQEVYLWPLRARLVTLSACQTGLGKSVEGEGLLGLTRAFIYAGAQDVLCSLWPVSDESTAKLMERFYAALGKGASVEVALTEAQRSLLADEKTRHPFFWAAFVPVRGPQQ